ncbi:11055_t:CDS:2, partial [Racocetra fulgida]
MDENSPLIQRSKSVAAYNRDLSDSSDRQQKTPKSYSISKKPSIYTNLLSVPIHFDRISENAEAWVKKHIIITGSFDAMSLFEFLREFFCQDHGMTTMNTFALILNPDEPDDDTALLLEDPAFVNRVQYIKGYLHCVLTTTIFLFKKLQFHIFFGRSPAFRRSLEKVKADTASAAFLLSPKFSSNRDKDDAAQIIRALDILCIDEISMGLMAQSLVTPGFASLIVLLTISITDQIAHELKVNANHIKGANTWAIEYINGAQYEIYAASLSDYFVGKTFLECSEIIYTQLDATLFAIGAAKTLRLAQFNKPDHEGNLTQDTESVVIQSTHKLDDDGQYSFNDAFSVPI